MPTIFSANYELSQKSFVDNISSQFSTNDFKIEMYDSGNSITDFDNYNYKNEDYEERIGAYFFKSID